MSLQNLNFPRHFQIWKYTVSHGMLFLRSPKGRGFTTRIDILFKNVAAINLPTTLDEISIHKASEEEKVAARPFFKGDLGQRKMFIVQGKDFQGYVIAGAAFSQEDTDEYDAPSAFDMK